jgi:hypothetical protein
MGTALRFAAAALAGVIVEAGFLWALTHLVTPPLWLAVAVAFAAGYVALFVALHLLGLRAGGGTVGAQLDAYLVFGLAVLLLVEVMLQVCIWLELDRTPMNAVLLLATACWVALGWPVLARDGRARD